MNKHKYPEIFQKKSYNKAYFEGWYYKQVTADGKHTISFIPGVNYDKEGGKCFIQCLHLNENNELKAYNIDYPIDKFSTKNQPFSVTIHKNVFTLNHMKLELNSKDLKVSGNINLSHLTPIERNFFMPNIMGFFSYIPFMECNHGLISMNHNLSGQLKVNGELIDFTGGKGYIEKDWGKSFPSAYIWIQSNHFEDETTGFFCSVATIPMLSFRFKGFICNLRHQGREYRFATYNGSKIKINDVFDDKVHLLFENKHFSLELKGESLLSKSLLAPKMGSMDKMIKEGLSGEIHLLLKNHKGQMILSTKSHQCGMEIVEALLEKS